jgi:molybdopterin synthase catalytic subunit
MNRFVSLSQDPLVLQQVFAAVADSAAGAVDLFVGTTRDRSEGRVVRSLEYEAFEPMAVRVMDRLIDEAAARWSIRSAAILHRLGSVPVGEASVIIAVAGVHRSETFEACRYLIDRLKAEVPIWKQERFEGGSGAWVGIPAAAASEGT